MPNRAMNSAGRHAVLTAISLVIGTFLVWWVEPNTTAGVTLLVAGAVVLINGLEAAVWRPPNGRPRIWIGWMTASILVLSQTACENAEGGMLSKEEEERYDYAFSTCMYAKGNQMPGTAGPRKDPGAFASDQVECKSYASDRARGQAVAAGWGAVGALIGGGRGAGLGNQAGALTGAAGSGSHEPLRPGRAFLSASNIPPVGVGAYGVVALRTLPTPANHDRLMMACRAFLASLPAGETLPANIALIDQMITVWPLSQQASPATQLTECDYLTNNYDLYGGISAIEDAEGQGHLLKGRGPFLIGWSPSNMRGRPDAVVLVVDMSGFDSQRSFDDAFNLWQEKIVEDPSLWRSGFSLEHLRLAIRDFADHYGQSIVDALKFWRKG